MNRAPAKVAVLGAAYLLSVGSIYLVEPGADRVLLVVLASLVCFAIYLPALSYLRESGRGIGATIVVIVVALGARLILLPAEPCTSDDVYRYIWEGLVQVEGHSPYEYAPLDPELTPLRERYPDVFDQMNHPNCATIYGPLAQQAFRLSAWLAPGSVVGWKLLLLFFEAGAIALLWFSCKSGRASARCDVDDRSASALPTTARAKARGSGVARIRGWLSSRRRAPEEDEAFFETGGDGLLLVAYLWCPLVVFETYEAGHLDLLGAGLLTMAWCWRRRWWWASALAMGGSIAVKYFWPLLVVPLLLRGVQGRRRRWAYVAVSAAAALLLFLPYWGGQGRLASVCEMFLSGWRTCGPFAFVEYALPKPWWLAVGIVVACAMLSAVILAWRSRNPGWREVQIALGTGLVLMPVVYPWYLVWLAPGLAWRRGWCWLTWVGIACLWHEGKIRQLSTGVWAPNQFLAGTVMAGLCALLILEWWEWATADRT